MHLNLQENPVSLMKLIIEHEATFENNSDIEVKVTQKKIITSISKRNTMKQDTLDSQIDLTSKSPLEVSVHA